MLERYRRPAGEYSWIWNMNMDMESWIWNMNTRSYGYGILGVEYGWMFLL